MRAYAKGTWFRRGIRQGLSRKVTFRLTPEGWIALHEKCGEKSIPGRKNMVPSSLSQVWWLRNCHLGWQGWLGCASHIRQQTGKAYHVVAREQTPKCKHFSSLYLCDICFYLIGQSKLHDQGWSQCERTPLQGMDTGRCNQIPVAMYPIDKKRGIWAPWGYRPGFPEERTHISRVLQV